LIDHKNPNQVLALARRGPDTAIELLSIGPNLKKLADFGQMLGQVASGTVATRPTTKELAAFGNDLFKFLFQGSLKDLYQGLPQNGAISLQILSNRPDLKSIPWEYLVTPDRQPSPHRERSVVRVQQTLGISHQGAGKLGKNLKILVVAADPVDQQGVSWEDVSRRIERALNSPLLRAANVALTVIPGATRRQLQQALLLERFDIFHFIGHGELNDKGEGGLVLVDVDNNNKSDFIAGRDVALVLAGRNTKLAILSACLSSAGKFTDDFDTVATSLIKAGIPAVVANQYPITYESLAPFVESLYTSLFTSGDIDEAVAEGRIALAIGLANKTDAAVLEWGLPTLHRLADARQLFEVAR
jgi:hypothetical protein